VGFPALNILLATPEELKIRLPSFQTISVRNQELLILSDHEELENVTG
jgi:hypothetical protein